MLKYNKTQKKGFSLAEALITLLIMSVVIGMTLQVIPKPKTSSNTTITSTTYTASQAITLCNSGNSTACATAYANNWNQGCTQVLAAVPTSTTGSYNLTPNGTTVPNVTCNMTNLASAAITGCTGGSSVDCAYGYANNLNRGCTQIKTSFPAATTGTYSLSTSSAGASTSAACSLTSMASAAITGCNASTPSTVDCAYGYTNGYNQSCAQIQTAWTANPWSNTPNASTTYNYSTSSSYTTGNTCVLAPPDTSCGATNIVTGSETLRVSLCNNSINAQADNYSQTSGCWVGTDTGNASAGNNLGGQAYQALPICTQDAAANACSALNGGINYGTNNWRLPTSAELGYWNASIKPTLGLCDSSSSYSPYCSGYTGCSGSGDGMCHPSHIWVADSTIWYYLNNGSWSSGNYAITYACSVRCVRNQ